MKTEYSDCLIPAGKNRNARKTLNQMATVPGVYSVDPWKMRCQRCRTEWDDVVLNDPHEVSCSNCYSDNVAIVEVRVTWIEAKDLATEENR